MPNVHLRAFLRVGERKKDKWEERDYNILYKNDRNSLLVIYFDIDVTKIYSAYKNIYYTLIM